MSRFRRIWFIMRDWPNWPGPSEGWKIEPVEPWPDPPPEPAKSLNRTWEKLNSVANENVMLQKQLVALRDEMEVVIIELEETATQSNLRGNRVIQLEERLLVDWSMSARRTTVSRIVMNIPSGAAISAAFEIDGYEEGVLMENLNEDQKKEVLENAYVIQRLVEQEKRKVQRQWESKLAELAERAYEQMCEMQDQNVKLYASNSAAYRILSMLGDYPTLCAKMKTLLGEGEG